MAFGENLMNLRKQNKMTQEQVAEKLEISRQTVSNWELNQTKPDLDQLIGLSRLYNVSLDELAEIDIKASHVEKRPTLQKVETRFSKCRRYLIENKNIWIMILALLCIIAMGICGMVDYALNNNITWSSVPLISIIFGYIVILPLFAKKHKIVLFILFITVAILPYLYLLESVLPIKNWYNSLAVPIASISVIGLWTSYAICKYLKINEWYKVAILVSMWAGIITPIINYIAGSTHSYLSFQNITNIFSSLVISLLCIIYGYIRSTKKSNKK